MARTSDEFTLWDLKVEVVAGEGEMVCNHRVGDFLELSGENLTLPPGQSFSIYSLAALLPLLPAKQRDTDPNDWMTTDAEVACPDPNCGPGSGSPGPAGEPSAMGTSRVALPEQEP